MSMSAYTSVCLSIHEHISRTTIMSNLHQTLARYLWMWLSPPLAVVALFLATTYADFCSVISVCGFSFLSAFYAHLREISISHQQT